MAECFSASMSVSTAFFFALLLCFVCFALFHCVSIYFIIMFQKPVSCLMRNRQEVDSDGREGWEELGGTKGEGTAIRIYYVRKKSIFNKRK